MIALNTKQDLTNVLNQVEELAQNPTFIAAAIETSKKLGITAEEWNANKVAILMTFANKYILNS